MENNIIEEKDKGQPSSDVPPILHDNILASHLESDNKDVDELANKISTNMNINEENKDQSIPNMELPRNNNDSNNNNNLIANNNENSLSIQTYDLKTIDWKDHDKGTTKIVRIILQNENGPCPLVAICNVLLIRGDIQIQPFERPTVTFDYLVECLGDYLLNHAPNDRMAESNASPNLLSTSPATDSSFNKNIDQQNTKTNTTNNHKQSTTEYVLTYRHNLDAAFTILPRLQSGLDVNVHFNSIREFEPTAELALFDLFNVDIVHGWIVDPQDKETYRVVAENCKSYNGVVECIVRGNENIEQTNNNNIEQTNNNNTKEDNIHDGLVASTFLQDTATQLTYYGIELLRDSLPKNKLCVLFRNNHFSTLFKHPITEQLYTLITDSGYVSESNIVWETLNDIDQGTSKFVNSEFRENLNIHQQEQENADLKYAIELSIKQHQQDEILRTEHTSYSNITSSPSIRTNHTRPPSKISQKKKSCVIS